MIFRYHLHGDPHSQASNLSDVILGGQDGLVNVLGVILGVAAATHDARIILVAGLAAAFAKIDFDGSSGVHFHPGGCRFLRERTEPGIASHSASSPP